MLVVGSLRQVVDLFFLIGGFLVAFTMYKTLKKKMITPVIWLFAVMYRFLRI